MIPLEKIGDCKWRIPKSGKMRVDGLIYASEKLLRDLAQDPALEQVANVAQLPGIVKHSIAMPDIHWGYGFPIGGVAAFRPEDGVVSPGGVGYDINCGVRLLRSDIALDQARQKAKDLVVALFRNIPTGVGSHRKDLKLAVPEMKKMAREGALWAVSRGFGSRQEIEHIEEGGVISGADPDQVSEKAYERGRSQLGTLGSGNHFVEVGFAEEIFDEEAAAGLGIRKDFVTVIVHTGSRGFGYQICDDYLRVMDAAVRKYGIELPDRQLACAPLDSPEGKKYLSAMACGANFAFNNRQLITHWVRESFENVFRTGPSQHGLRTVYDVCHNIAKIEKHPLDGKEVPLCVHRKGATRAFPPGHPAVPESYRSLGQPILVPGDMGRCSYVLVGTQNAYQETFGTACHGAGRVMSRHQAKKAARGRSIVRELEAEGIHIMADGYDTIAEEMPDAYKNVSDVVEVVHRAGIGRKVARLKPLCVIKG
ncbi:MAG TPA: RtcB family protein [Candidatus Omnitrophota bacterium]|nr:RtcB family protein [Candidatus Omnitrophota bacterium]